MVYDMFAEVRGWHPRQVDELTLDELDWLPVMSEARAKATRQIASQQ